MKSKVTTAPATEPITLADLKLSLRITSTAEDTFLTQLITDARESVERYTNQKLITQTITGYGSPFNFSDDVWWEGYMVGHSNMITGPLQHMELDHGPVQSITSVETIDTDNAESAYASSNYYLDNYDLDLLPRIEFNQNATHPSSIRRQNGWKVVYVAGYGDNATDVPADIRRAITVLAGYMWANRGACGDGESCMDGCGVKFMLRDYRLIGNDLP